MIIKKNNIKILSWFIGQYQTSFKWKKRSFFNNLEYVDYCFLTYLKTFQNINFIKN